MFLWYYGNDVFKDGEIGYWYFSYLSKQIPALEANTIMMQTEATIFAQGLNNPQSKKRFHSLQELVKYGVK